LTAKIIIDKIIKEIIKTNFENSRTLKIEVKLLFKYK